ncbi:hypothetical protein BJ912DRAFT_949088 [Pholiota molesta]|nr:hypothetical protein BJ912DRAFT_949088 [Pholiota molesta]
MDAHPDPSSSPTEPPQLLSAKFLRKTKLRKEDLSNEHAEAPIVENLEMTTNATYIEMKEKLEPATTVAAARNTSDTVLATLAAQTSSSPPPEALEATLISEENEVPNNIAHSSPEGISTVTSGTFDATKFLAQSNTLSSSSPLDHAKTLVLDLLGWGVDPEYLIESGVSAEVVFRVFTDLNLRLPKNLVISQELVNVAYSWGPRPSELTQSV